MSDTLKGKVAVVTGGARNIGRHLVERLAREGATVLFCDVLDEEGTAVASALRPDGYSALYHHTDLRQPQQIEQLALAAAAYGKIDLWVHNGMVDVRRSVVELMPEEWDAVQDVCLRAAFLGAKYAIPHMPPGSSLINISSVHALVSYAHAPAYAAAKAGLIALTRQIAAEYGERGIRANVLVPGLIVHPGVSEGYDEKSLPFYPVQRLGLPEDIAEAVLFLASPAARFISGAALVIDGGMTARSPEWHTHASLDDDSQL
ncbi:MAG: SDR family oxidoreductase [bacterium]|nr:SDR family oxidoreductase [bacterium]